MRKRIFIAMLVVFAAVIGVVVLRELFSKEPKYRGKTASAWLKGYYLSEGNLGRRKEAAEALRQMGPDGIGFLVNQFYSTNIHSSLRTNIHTFLAKLPLLHFPEYVPPEFVFWRAGDMIIEVHPTSDVLLPLLSNRLHSTDEGERLKAV